jgi:hypothetical protein
MDNGMTGIVYHTNASRNMYSVRLSNNTFTVFELVDPVILSRNTELRGELDHCGDCEIVSAEGPLHIHIDIHGLNEVMAFQKTFLMI